ncbi:MAG TPA: glycine zipper 2TM domain-containing protein [Burkholderiaceae bacterium]|nr:glycine zipper 2TM domain-containing protein [Burkholderiaceae bacterium]
MNAMTKSVVLFAAIAACAGAAQAETFFDQARVRGVEPQYETVAVPRNECTSQWVNETRRTSSRDYGGAVIGGVAGAVLGNQVGRGHGREAATAVGAVVGAMTGDNIANRDHGDRYEQVPREVTSCRTVQDMQQRLTGYRVNYEYRGQMYSTFMHEQPGPTLRVRVSVDPM